MRPVASPEVIDCGHIGHYRIVRKLGAGRWGAVFEAVHELVGRRVALKVLSAEFACQPTLSTQLLEAIEAAARVHHPGLVQLFEFARLADGSAYLAMDYLDGETLTRRLARQGGPLAMRDALQLAWQLAEALTAAHARDVCHGDLKPDSIMLVAHAAAPAGEQAKILGLGLGHLADVQALLRQSAIEQVGVPTGTALYLAPERWQGVQAPPKAADVYALGAIVYQLLTGQVPFVASSASELMALHVRAAPGPIQERCPQLSEGLAALLQQMLHKLPRARPWMLQVAQALRRLVDAELASTAPRDFSVMLSAAMCAPELEALRASASPPSAMPSAAMPAEPAAATSLLRHLIGSLVGGDESRPPDPEAALSQLDRGCFGLDAPRRMTLGRAVKVTAAAVRDRVLRALVQASAEHGAPQITDTQLGRLVRVELIPDSPEEFTVTPLSECEQPVLRTELTQWEWLITPRQAGPRKRLRVRATNIVDVHGKRLTKSHPVRTLEVDVTVDAASLGPSEEVSTATVRQLLDALLPSDSTLEAFCLDYFPRVLLRFGSGMERLQKVTLLLSTTPPAQVLARLRDAEPEQLERLQAQLGSAPSLAPVRLLADEPDTPPEQEPAPPGPQPPVHDDEPAPALPRPPALRTSVGRRWGRRLLWALLLLILGAELHRCSTRLPSHQVNHP